MIRKVLFVIIILGITNQIKAQTDTTKYWKAGGVYSLNLSQVALSNWLAGGQNSSSANSLFNMFINYKKNSFTWDNTIDLGYGMLKQQRADFVKTDDHIDISSKLGKSAFNKWFYSVLLNFKTQFSAGYNYPNDSVRISDFMAPGYGLLAAGLDYKPNDDFTILIAPITAKFTYVGSQTLSNAGAFGLDPAEYDNLGNLVRKGDNLRTEAGGYVKVAFKKKVMENISVQMKTDFFSNYLDNPENIDITGELLVSLKVNKYISATVLTNYIYDDDIRIPVDTNDDGKIDREGPRTQLKEVLAVGFSYKF